MKKRKEEKEVPSFIDIEADEESSMDVSSEYIESEDVDGISSTQIEHKPRDWQKFTEDLAKKYGKDEVEEEEESVDSEVVEEIKRTPQYLLLPDARSPRLWIVRVVRGKEKEISLRILHNLSEDNAIISIIAKPDLLGYIYIESFTKQAVVDALQTVRFVNRTKISPVPLNEMIDVMTIKCVEDVKIGSFVRVKKGKYKNDVAQVINSINNEMVRIRIIPRIDNIQKKFDNSNFDEKFVQTKIVDKKKAFIYKKEVYVDGFLEKDVMINSLYFDVDVSFEEARVFEKKRKFNINEKVRVRRGDLINMIGLIKNIERNEVEMEVHGELFRMNLEDVEKSYCEGDEISFNGRNAVIVKNDGNSINFIYVDTFGEQGIADIDEIEPPITQKKYEIVKNMNIMRTKRDPYLNHSVQILKGEFKGYFGVVKDVFKDSCRILMDSNLKYVNIDREDVVLKESYAGAHSEDQQNDSNVFTGVYNRKAPGTDKTPDYRQEMGKTPRYPSDLQKTPGYRNEFGNRNEYGRTPGYRSEHRRTPGYRNDQGRTPGYSKDQGRTPGYSKDQGRTPGYSNDQGRTPGYSNDQGRTLNYKNDQGRTPGYSNDQGRTPGYSNDQGRTPGYSNDKGRISGNKSEYDTTPGYRNAQGRRINDEIRKTPGYGEDSGMTPGYREVTRTSGYREESSATTRYRNEYGVDSHNGYQNINGGSYPEYNSKSSKNLSLKNNNWSHSSMLNNGDDAGNVLVKVNGKERILKEIRDNKYILDDNNEYLEVNWVFPDKYDKVRVMEGKEEGFMGILIGVEDNIGVIRNDNGDVKNIQVDFLTRRG